VLNALHENGAVQPLSNTETPYFEKSPNDQPGMGNAAAHWEGSAK
jgi:hypothetical protein